jgi:hypothetical protein
MYELRHDFIERNKDSIICEPSGRTLEELQKNKVLKMMLVEG